MFYTALNTVKLPKEVGNVLHSLSAIRLQQVNLNRLRRFRARVQPSGRPKDAFLFRSSFRFRSVGQERTADQGNKIEEIQYTHFHARVNWLSSCCYSGYQRFACDSNEYICQNVRLCTLTTSLIFGENTVFFKLFEKNNGNQYFGTLQV